MCVLERTALYEDSQGCCFSRQPLHLHTCRDWTAWGFLTIKFCARAVVVPSPPSAEPGGAFISTWWWWAPASPPLTWAIQLFLFSSSSALSEWLLFFGNQSPVPQPLVLGVLGPCRLTLSAVRVLLSSHLSDRAPCVGLPRAESVTVSVFPSPNLTAPFTLYSAWL